MSDYDGTVFDILYQIFGKGEEIYERIGRLEDKAAEEFGEFRDVAAKKYGMKRVPADPADFARAVVLDEFRRAVSRSNYDIYKKTGEATKKIQKGLF